METRDEVAKGSSNPKQDAHSHEKSRVATSPKINFPQATHFSLAGTTVITALFLLGFLIPGGQQKT